MVLYLNSTTEHLQEPFGNQLYTPPRNLGERFA